VSERAAIKIHELVDLNDEPLWIYAEGHHDRAAFLAAIRDWERETSGKTEDLYRVKDVHHKWLGTEGTGEGEVYLLVGPDHVGAMPVTLVWTA
jgi:hypothetical protein